jgi:hypothetical protein
MGIISLGRFIYEDEIIFQEKKLAIVLFVCEII